MDRFYSGVLAASKRAGVAAGVFCLGRERAGRLAGEGFRYVGFNTDLNALIGYAQGELSALR